MKATCERSVLTKNLRFVQSFVGTSSLNQIYRLLYVEAGEGCLTFKSMNGLAYTCISFPANAEKEEAILIDPTVFTPVVDTLQDGDIKLQTKKNRLEVRQGRSHRSLSVIPGEEFPDIPKVDEKITLTLPLSHLLGHINLVEFAVSDTRDRPILQGMYLSPEGLLLGGDGRRLASTTVGEKGKTGVVMASIVRDVLRGLTSVAEKDEVTITYGDMGWMRLATDNATVYIAILAGEYPSTAARMVDTLLKEEGGTIATFDRSVLIPSLQVACVYSEMAKNSQESQAVTIDLSKKGMRLTLDTSNGDIDDSVEMNVMGEDISAKVHPDLFLQALRAAPQDEVTLTVWSPHRPLLFKSPGSDWCVIQTPMVDKTGAEEWQKEREKQVQEERADGDELEKEDF